MQTQREHTTTENPPPKTCKHPGCVKQLQPHNTIGFCREHRLDARLGSQLCKHAGCTMCLGQDHKTGYCGLHKGDAKRPPDLSPEELAEHRRDDHWEERHSETDTVACRICGEQWACLGSHGRTNHLLKDHALSVSEYRQYCKHHGWGTPLIRSLKSQDSIAKWRRDNPKKIKALQQRKNRKDKERLATDSQFREHQHEQVRKNAQRKLSEEEQKVRVQCEMENETGRKCGEWYRRLEKHLRHVHGITGEVYTYFHPGAPIAAPDLVDQATNLSDQSKRLWADRKYRLLPTGIDSFSEEEQKITLILKADQLRGGHMSDPELRKILPLRLSRRSLNRFRKRIGIPGPIGRPPTNM